MEQALQTCVGKLGALVENNKQDEARNLVIAGIKLYIQMCRVENQELIKLVANIWAKAGQDLIGGAFRGEMITIVEGYCNKWVTAAERKDKLEDKAMGTAGMEVLLAAAGSADTREVGRQVTAHFVVILQRVLHSGNPNLKNWLLYEAEPISTMAITRQSIAAVVVGMEFYLAVVEDKKFNELREILLGTGTTVFGEIARAGLLDGAKTAIEYLAEERFTACTASNQGRISLDRLEENILEALDWVSVAGNQIPQLETVIEKLKEVIKGYAQEARLEFPDVSTTGL